MPASTWRTSVPMSTITFKSFVAFGIASAEMISPTRISTLAKSSIVIWEVLSTKGGVPIGDALGERGEVPWAWDWVTGAGEASGALGVSDSTGWGASLGLSLS